MELAAVSPILITRSPVLSLSSQQWIVAVVHGESTITQAQLVHSTSGTTLPMRLPLWDHWLVGQRNVALFRVHRAEYYGLKHGVGF